MRILSAVLIAAAIVLVAAVKPPYTPLFSPECDDQDFPYIGYDHAGFGFYSHNDYLGGDGYHHYSFDDPDALVTVDLVGSVLTISGTAIGGVPSGETTVDYSCTSTVGTIDTGLTATGCSGSYTHHPSGTTVDLTGKANGDGYELLGGFAHNHGGHFVIEAWYMFAPAFDPTATAVGDFLFRLGCGGVCGDGVVNAPGETCDPPGSPAGPLNNICREDCTFCGDGVIDEQHGETCEPSIPVPGGEICDPQQCIILLIPTGPCPDFDETACYSAWDVVNGNSDGGAYIRNSFWGGDYTPRDIIGGSFTLCADEPPDGLDTFVLDLQLDGGALGTCTVMYGCDSVDYVSSTLIGAEECSGTMSCPGQQDIAIAGKAAGSGYEVECVGKYGTWKCMGWIMWFDGTVVGDIVWAPVCPPDEDSG